MVIYQSCISHMSVRYQSYIFLWRECTEEEEEDLRILVVGYYFWSKKALPDFLFGILFGQIFRSSISKVLDLFVKGLAAVYQRKCSFSSRKALSDRPLLGEAWKYQNGWIFRKVPNRFWPFDLIFGKSYCRFVGTHRRLHVLVLLSNIFSM